MSKEYSASNIQVLEGLEPVRKRPGMYIGSTGARGLHHLVWEIVDNAVDEALGGYASRIDVTITQFGEIVVEDDGRGIPVAIHPKTGRPALETVFTVLHAGGKFDKDSYKVSGGLHGVGASVVNALSERLEASVCRDGAEYCIIFCKGKPEGEMRKLRETEEHGTKIKFAPDFSIMDDGEFDFDVIADRLRQTAYLNSGLKITVKDERNSKQKEFLFPGGIREYVHELSAGKTPINEEIIFASGQSKGEDNNSIDVEVALQYNEGYRDSVLSYVNNISTSEGGTHEAGLFDAIMRIFNNYIVEQKIKEKEKLQKDDIKEGLVAVISVKHTDPVFEGQTKNKLGNKDARMAVNRIISEQLERFLLENPEVARKIVSKLLQAQKARFNAEQAREATRRKGPFDMGALPGKLADCASKNAEISELYIVEGDSAGGSAKLGRNREIQAILPLRGKVINAEKSQIDKVFANNEIGALITALGTGIMNEFNINKLRYHKIVIMTDADVDGAHIRTLLLTFFYRHLRPLIEYGFVYIAQPPLYRVSTAKATRYCYSDQEKNTYLQTIGADTKFQIQRYKGLGEMDPEQLWETTMDPAVRQMLQVQIEDAAAAELAFSTLMGDDVAPRKEFINKNAKYVRIDV